MRPAMRMPLRRRKSLAGKRKMESEKCAKIPGDGKAITRMDMKSRNTFKNKAKKTDSQIYCRFFAGIGYEDNDFRIVN